MSFFFARNAVEAIAHRDAATDETSMLGLLVGHHALSRSRLEAEGTAEGSTDVFRETALHRAAQSGDRLEVEMLLAAGHPVDKKDANKRTPFALACLKGHRGTASLLISYGADVCSVDSFKRTPLHLAAVGNNAKLVWLLIQKGVDVSALDEDGQSPLSLAIMIHNKAALEVVKLLVENGAEVNSTDTKGRTPLHHACSTGSTAIVKFLSLHKADLLTFDADHTSAIHEASLCGHVAIIEHLLARGVDVDYRNQSGWTPLMEAVLEGHEDAARALMNAGASVSGAESGNSDTVLHLAARHVVNLNRVELFLDLLDAGADPMIPNKSGTTVVKLLSRVRFNRSGLYDLLIQHITARVNRASLACGLFMRTSFLLRARASGREAPETEALLDALIDVPLDVFEDQIFARSVAPYLHLAQGLHASDSAFPRFRLAPSAVQARKAAAARAREWLKQ